MNGRRVFLVIVALTAVVVVSACVAMGWRFGPGFPCTRGTLFAQPPVVERRGDGYVLTWTQGAYPFYFVPAYQVREGRLVFAVAATSSSGSVAGRHRELVIEGAENLQALQRGGAYWWEREPEPEGTFVRLEIIDDDGTGPETHYPRPVDGRLDCSHDTAGSRRP